jgi:hypothetical protein
MIDKQYLRIGKNRYGEAAWICGHCQQPADHAKSAQDADRLVHLLMCPTGTVTLGEWATLNEKEADLAAYMVELEQVRQ